jgi:glucose-1-phosphate thymidylyltransferase
MCLTYTVGCAGSFVDNDDFGVNLGDNMLNQGIVDIVDGLRAGQFDAGIDLEKVDCPTI